MNVVVHIALAGVCLAALVVLLGASLERGWMPDHRLGWSQRPSFEAASLAGLVQIAALCLLEAFFVFMLNAVRDMHPVLAEARNRNVLARVTFSAIALVFISHQGWVLYRALEWESAVTHATPHARLYVQIPAMHFLITAMVAFQVKNLADTLRWSDGPEFVAHHIVTILVGIVNFEGSCCHLYGIFFFGLSEASTAIIGVLAAFDPALGVPNLDRHFPIAKQLLGAAFVLSFLVIRIAIWPVISWQMCSDCLAVMADGTAHVPAVLWTNMLMLGGLTVLQFYWLNEIRLRASEEVRALMAPKAHAS